MEILVCWFKDHLTIITKGKETKFWCLCSLVLLISLSSSLKTFDANIKRNMLSYILVLYELLLVYTKRPVKGKAPTLSLVHKGIERTGKSPSIRSHCCQRAQGNAIITSKWYLETSVEVMVKFLLKEHGKEKIRENPQPSRQRQKTIKE